MERRIWDPITGAPDFEPFAPPALNVGDVIQGDKIYYFPDTFTQMPYTPSGESQYFIYTPLVFYPLTISLRWKYNPFIPLRLQYFGEELKRANISGSSYDQSTNIPYYATDIGGGNYVWRELLEQGYIDPLTGNGVEYPFVNKRRYLFENVVVSVIPDLDHPPTANTFRNIKFGEPIVLDHNPIAEDIGDLGRPCK